MEHFIKTLRSLADYEVVNKAMNSAQARFVGRIHGKGADAQRFLYVCHAMLMHCEKHDIPLDVSKIYMLRGSQLVHGWRLIIGLPRPGVLDELDNLVRTLPKPSVELKEVPLVGARKNRDSLNARGKGAQSAYSPIVGPEARRKLGG